MSLRAELVRLGLRWFVKRKIGPASTLEALRRQDAFLERLVPPPPKGTQATHVDLDGVKALAVITPASHGGRLVLYLHGGGLVGFIAANLIAFCRSKTVSKAVHAPPADGPCRKAGTVCVGVNLISADGTPGVSVAVSVRAYTLVADRACRSAVAVTVSADVLATDPACRVAVSISVRVHSAIAVYTCRITRSIRVKDGALGVQRRNRYRQHQHCKDGACHRTPLLL